MNDENQITLSAFGRNGEYANVENVEKIFFKVIIFEGFRGVTLG